MHKIQTDCTALLLAAKNRVEAQEKACQAMAGQMAKLDVELRLKTEQVDGLQAEASSKRQEMARLSSSRTMTQQCQLDFENATRTYEEFMGTYVTKSAQYKKQIKVFSNNTPQHNSICSAVDVFCTCAYNQLCFLNHCDLAGYERPDSRPAGGHHS